MGHAGFIRGLMEESGFSAEEIQEYKRLIANKNSFGVEEMIEEKDLSSRLKELLIRLPDLFGAEETLAYARERVSHPLALEALQRLETVQEILGIYGLEESVTFDLGMLSHYDYYTGIIFKAYTYGTGEAIVTGGRYDKLIQQFGKKSPAVGLAIVLDQLMNALASQHAEIPTETDGILILYRSASRREAVHLGNRYRNEGCRVMLMRRDAETELEVYRGYASENQISSIVYVEGDQTTTIDL